MSEMKCPICGNDLEQYHTGFVCYRHCLNGKNVWGGEETLKELDRTRKALAIAVRAIETIKYSKKSDAINLRHKANKALIEIYKIKDQTALEQKDK